MDIDSELRMNMLKAYYLIKFGVDMNSPMLSLNGEQIFAQLIVAPKNCRRYVPPVDDPDYDPEEVRQIVSEIQQIINMN